MIHPESTLLRNTIIEHRRTDNYDTVMTTLYAQFANKSFILHELLENPPTLKKCEPTPLPLQHVETPGVTTAEPTFTPTFEPPKTDIPPTMTPQASILPKINVPVPTMDSPASAADRGTPFNLVKAQEWRLANLQHLPALRPPPEPPPNINNLQITGVATPPNKQQLAFSYLF
jgi:hypothetical protein